MKKRKRQAGRRKTGRLKLFVFVLFSVFTIIASFVLANLDDKILGPILSITDQTSKSRINRSIDRSLQNITRKNALETSDFYVKTTDSEGMILSLSVNTVLVNDICSQLAVEISTDLENIGKDTIRIPLATIFNFRAFANLGPSYPITILPMGSAVVDYETKFEAVGINEINFQLWLRVDAKVRVVNPVQNKDMIVSRKIALVNTVFSGKVPDTYLNNIPLIPVTTKPR